MKVRDLMNSEPITLVPSMEYAEVMRVFNQHKISGAPVLNDVGELVGIVSEKDLFRILYPFYKSYYMNPEQYVDHEERESKAADIRGHKVEVFMTTPVHTVYPDMPIMQAGAIMLSKSIHRLPVVENAKLVGIIDRRKIYRAIMEMNYESVVKEK